MAERGWNVHCKTSAALVNVTPVEPSTEATRARRVVNCSNASARSIFNRPSGQHRGTQCPGATVIHGRLGLLQRWHSHPCGRRRRVDAGGTGATYRTIGVLHRPHVGGTPHRFRQAAQRRATAGFNREYVLSQTQPAQSASLVSRPWARDSCRAGAVAQRSTPLHI